MFKPKFPEKYGGDVNNIVFRSSWELRVMTYLDTNTNILAWSSEELAIPYISPMDNKPHRYFPDFVVKIKDRDDNVRIQVWEVKPAKETKPPNSKNRRTFLIEAAKYSINQAKWDAARELCSKNDWEFHILTEKELKV